LIDWPGPLHPWPIGAGPRYQPAALVRDGSPVGGLRCGSGRTFAVHVELFAHRRAIAIPRGIGVARSGCRYPNSTRVPTGVFDVRRDRPYVLGDLFLVWGRRLGESRLLSFPGRIFLYVDGLRRTGDPRTLRLTPHAQIVVEVGAHVAPHAHYLFP
jgi:hypothetical protein